MSATVQNRRFYGLLVDQEALKRASVLWFQDEAGSLDLNRRMKMLCSQQSASKDEGKAEEPSSAPDDTDGDKKRPAAEVGPGAEAYAKRIKLEDGTTAVVPEQIKSTMEVEQAAKSGDPHKRPVTQASHHRQVQKFRYELPADKDNPKDLGLRYLLATYADIEAASEGDTEKAKLIDEACQAGGGFVGKFYYQYEVGTVDAE